MSRAYNTLLGQTWPEAKSREWSKEFVILVAIANLVAVPVAWYFANGWLSGFAFRMAISPMLFVWTLATAVSLTLLTVGYQTIRAAVVNPVNSLRYE